MLFAGVDKKDAQRLKKFLDKHGLIAHEYPVFSEDSKVFFPVINNFSDDTFELEFVEKELPKKTTKSFSELVKDRFGDVPVRKSFDILGKIAVLEIPKELDKHAHEIGELFLKAYPHVETVVKKVGAHEGEFRVQKFEVIAGMPNFEAEYVENGCRFRLDISKMYFSPRLGSERLRIAKQVEPGEKVLAMFSGYSPYPITILKHSKPCCVYAIELNPDAHKYALLNKEINHIGDELKLINGDVVVEVPKLVDSVGLFDRILMPLPKTGNSFLKTAFSAVKDKGIIHFYYFLKEEDIPNKGWEIISKEAEKSNVSVGKISHTVCGQVGKRLYRVCFDFRVLK